MIGETLSHYRIVSKIGAGGMGEVYLAEDTRLDRKIALKLLLQEFVANEDRLRRFIQEAKAAAALNHPNIAHIYEVGEADGAHYIAMEYVDGDTLTTKMQRDRCPLAVLLKYLSQTAEGLAKAHAAGIVHRDLKPDNIMITSDGYAKILDFGLAKLIENQRSSITTEDDATAIMRAQPMSAAGTVMGTVGYMSPEQAQGKPVDQRSDIFSFGCILYEATTGRRPFEGDSAIDTLHKIIYSTVPAVTDFNPDAPTDLQRIIRRCLAKEPEKRYQTIRDVANDLEDLRREIDVDLENGRSNPPAYATAAGAVASQTTAGQREIGDVHPTSTSSAEYLVGEIKQHRLGIAVILALLLAVGVVGYVAFFTRAKSAAIESIAVMPFVNASGNADVEYLSDGMTETLISSLSQLPKLNVKARSSVFRYKGQEFDLRKIAQELKVQAILTGRVVQRGEQLTLSLELVEVQTENVVWSEQYNRKQSDLLTLQSEIARDVSGKLKTRLTGTDEAKVTKNYTTNPEAYQFYLKGRFYWNKRTPDALKQAIEFYNQAIEKDPNYALAYSGLAETYVIFAGHGVASAKDSMPQAKAAALRALELDNSLAEAHSALGWYLNYYEWDRIGAEQSFQRAIELNPNYATAYDWLGSEALAPRKRFDEALVSQRRAEELDPLSPVISANVSWTLFFARRYDEAIAQLNRTLALDPNFSIAHANLSWAFSAKGMHREAIAEIRKARELNNDAFLKGYHALVLAKSGQREEAAKLLDELKRESPRSYVTSYALALAYIGLNDKEEALAWLEKEVEERGYWAGVYAVAPELDELRADPRFKNMLKRLNLPE
jgi:serine/threonine protein kinase/Flp pilus assembly protein TadD